MFKHELLKRYLPQFGGMTGSRSHDKRVVYLDGYAGEGRYESGEPASAELALRIAADLQSRAGLTLECFFSESHPKSSDLLQEVVQQYRASGVLAHAHRGEVDGVLDQVVERAEQEPLFLFLDPCGLLLPQDRLVDVLSRKRPHKKWPPTELLMNFSMMAVWRLGGHVRSPQGNEKSLQRFDDVCGGTWWREYFADAVASREKEEAAQDAIEAVAAEYRQRLARRTGMLVQAVPVSHSPRKRAVYQLVFATRSPYGVWVFGDSVARARNEWWETLEMREDDALFSVTSVTRPDPKEVEARAVPQIAANLEKLLLTGRPVKLVDHPLEIFGSFYGQVTEPAVRKAVQLLHGQGKTPSNGVGVRRTREITLYPRNRAA
ncbi:three-Cys-motif partner protein TcmP (plasmid) [Streptomyces sp. NBC_01426]|uniref:three-Cys-motif partner protein TcmP n=1 Tax=Streptomyces sp. NBC_01426 TaxID=2975866 RepID=UPI002E302101|nr:three-Cys-motif partner protein TcmP [Streptomyces sp. NBC_01426]